ncbi:MAG: ATP-binding protein [Christensenellales bacterium]|jgi:two-component system phosphate regulon sensor histidine kinase PhoR
MRKWVAWIATLLNLVISILFLLIIGSTARDSLNAAALDSVSRTCRLSASVADSAAFASEELYIGYLRSASLQTGCVFTLYDENGRALFVSRPFAEDVLSRHEISEIRKNGIHSFSRDHGKEGLGSYVFCGEALPDKSILLISQPAYTIADAYSGRIFAIAMLFLGNLLTIVILYTVLNGRYIMLTDALRKVLTDFSEGQYGARITGSVGNSMHESARFNEVLGRVQERLVKQNTRSEAFSAIINYMKSGIIAVDDQLNLLLVNAPAKLFLGITGRCEGEPINQCSQDVKLDSHFREAMEQQGVLYTNEVVARTAQGRSRRPLRLYISPMIKGGRVVGAVAIVEDVTELKRLETMRVDFVANVSHELKTPLTTIKGFIETLEEGAIDNPVMAKKFMGIIKLEADRLTRLINDLLSISKMESGTDAVPNEKICIDKLCRDVCEQLKRHGQDKNVTVTMIEPARKGLYVLGNPDRVRQMLLNLIENGIKYNKPEGGSVTVSLFEADGYVNLSIADTGIGIAEENLPRLFERFYRVDKGRSRAMGGTGLGLAIVKHILRSMNGMIEAHSRIGEGTEFLITIPVTDPPDDIDEIEET